MLFRSQGTPVVKKERAIPTRPLIQQPIVPPPVPAATPSSSFDIFRPPIHAINEQTYDYMKQYHKNKRGGGGGGEDQVLNIVVPTVSSTQTTSTMNSMMHNVVERQRIPFTISNQLLSHESDPAIQTMGVFRKQRMKDHPDLKDLPIFTEQGQEQKNTKEEKNGDDGNDDKDRHGSSQPVKPSVPTVVRGESHGPVDRFFEPTIEFGVANNEQKKRQVSVFLDYCVSAICNVFQPTYNHGKVMAKGLGDFLRGSFFIVQIAERYNFEPRFDITNHNLSKYLAYYEITRLESGGRNRLNHCTFVNVKTDISDDKHIVFLPMQKDLHPFFQYLLLCPRDEHGCLYTYTTALPIFPITDKHREYIQRLMQPIPSIQRRVDTILTGLRLEPRQYSIIHLRMGDQHLIHAQNEMDSGVIQRISNVLRHLPHNAHYLLLSDCYRMREFIRKKLSYLKIRTLVHPITHTGEGVNAKEDALENTLVEFQLFGKAKSIVCCSIYHHGSGFSKWASETFNVPYIAHFVG
mgnify:FL=1